MAGPRPSTLSAGPRGALRRVRRALARAGYEEKTLCELLGVAALPSFRRRRHSLPEYLHRTRGGSPLETLARLFLLREAVPADAVEAAGPAHPEDWVETGLAEWGPSGLRAAVELMPYEELVVAADWSGAAPADPFEVMGVSASSRALARTTVRRPAARALDLGTGCGLLALLAAAHSRSVVAIDVNPRALDFARWNAAFNGVTNIAFRQGDLFTPVQGETFDLIVCNPPFVLAPDVDYVHTHSGKEADALCREIVRAAPVHLAEGGLCQIVCNWAVLAGEDWRKRLKGWVTGTGCDVWVLHSHTEDAAAYAAARISEIENDPALCPRRFAEWMTCYRKQRIEAVGFGLITLRRRSGAAHVYRCEGLSEAAAAAGPARNGIFALRLFLEGVIRERPKGQRRRSRRSRRPSGS